MSPRSYDRFLGEIWGLGTSSGHRLVIGRWDESPFGAFTDVMHEAPDGTRRLVAPTREVADFVAATYRFDEVVIGPVTTSRTADRLRLEADDLTIEVRSGRRAPLGWLLAAVPNPIARSRWWCTLIDPVARIVLSGVRTCGTAGNGRREWYGATDQHRIDSLRATLGDDDLGTLTDVDPPVRFGFSSTPATPGVTTVTTTVRW